MGDVRKDDNFIAGILDVSCHISHSCLCLSSVFSTGGFSAADIL